MSKFDTLKIYAHKKISQEVVLARLTELGYSRVEEVFEEGDFSLRGDTLEVFPLNFNFPIRIEWQFEDIDKIYSFDKKLNKKIINYDLVIIIPYLKRRYSSEELPLDGVVRLKRGDYVVHVRYGIGKFRGVKQLKARDKEDYFFEIEYANKDKIYVSKEEAHLVQKYTNLGIKAPKLTRLGSKEWTRIKEKVQKGIKEFAIGILKMEAQRKIVGGHGYSRDGEWQKIFEESFPYEETDDQTKATRDVKRDMESPECMDRIICGDVGYGKTEVAMRAALKSIVDSKQVAFLVPTTILAYQHYTNLSQRMKDFPFKVEMLSRFRTHSQQARILEDLRSGKIDIIVGTHRLVSDDVEFADLGLLVVDEEHKFGVEHKEKIKRFKAKVDVLTLTATPIPRTLYMSLIGVKNISLIKTPPKQRLAIKTITCEFDSRTIAEAISKEFKRRGQVFFIHNRIQGIRGIEKILKKNLPPEVKIGVVHGRLPANAIEEAMLEFIEGNIDVLLSTAIVESGIDIPSANTIVINDAHRFGLADLHQLRGRVGRFNIQAYAYLAVPSFETIPEDARKRLEMIEEFSHLGSGFEIAMSDLELRGAGNILGKEQHGFIWMVGFDLYCRLLKKEIEYLRQVFNVGQ